MKVQLTSVQADCTVEGDALRFHVIGHDAAGREYVHEASWERFLAAHVAEKLVNSINAAGMVIDLAHWNCRAPYGTAAWLEDGMEDYWIAEEKAAA